MKVKVGDTVYDGNEQPVMVILSDEDKENLKNMPEDKSKYCSCPKDSDPEEIEKWMAEV